MSELDTLKKLRRKCDCESLKRLQIKEIVRIFESGCRDREVIDAARLRICEENGWTQEEFLVECGVIEWSER